MADINWLLAEIETGPQGPTVGAFFDFDGTLIKGYSATAFFKERIKTRDVDARRSSRPSWNRSTSNVTAKT